MVKLIHTNHGTFGIGNDGAPFQYNVKRTCIHEAGHAVLAYRLGSPVFKIVVLGFSDEDDDELNEREFNGLCLHPPNADRDNEAVITLAGYYAERIVLDHSVPRLDIDDIPDGHREEINQARWMVKSKDETRDFTEAFARVHNKTKNLVMDNERDIVKVARELGVRKCLTADRVEELLGDFTDHSATREQQEQFYREITALI